MNDETPEAFGTIPNTSEFFGTLPHVAETFRTVPHDSESFGTVRNETPEAFGTIPNASESFGTFPHVAETFRTVPHDSENFGTVRKTAEGTDHHSLSVREVARMFEEANVARTERSIINWCQPNRQGVTRLDAYFDSNERRYFITPESVTRAIEEERSRINASGATPPTSQVEIPKPSEIPKREERSQPKRPSSPDEHAELEELERELQDLKINNRVKDHFIEQLRKERDSFNDERQRYVGQLMSYSRTVGKLETQLLQLDAPVSESRTSLPHAAEMFGTDQIDSERPSEGFTSEPESAWSR